MKTEECVQRIEQHDAFLTSQGRVLYFVITGIHEQVELVGEFRRHVFGMFGKQWGKETFTHVKYASRDVFLDVGTYSNMPRNSRHERYVEV